MRRRGVTVCAVLANALVSIVGVAASGVAQAEAAAPSGVACEQPPTDPSSVPRAPAERGRADAAARPAGAPARLRGEAELAAFLVTPFEGRGGHIGIGWRALFGIGWTHIPLTLGFDFQSAYFGSARSRASIDTPGGTLFVDKKRDDTAHFIDSFLRLQPPYWWVRPYVEAVVGAKLLRTEYSLTFVNGSGAANTVSDSEWAHTLGIGAGVDLPVLGSGAFLTLGVRFLAGGHARYTRPVSPNSDDVVQYDTTTSTTLFSLGVSARVARPSTSAAE